MCRIARVGHTPHVHHMISLHDLNWWTKKNADNSTMWTAWLPWPSSCKTIYPQCGVKCTAALLAHTAPRDARVRHNKRASTQYFRLSTCWTYFLRALLMHKTVQFSVRGTRCQLAMHICVHGAPQSCMRISPCDNTNDKQCSIAITPAGVKKCSESRAAGYTTVAGRNSPTLHAMCLIAEWNILHKGQDILRYWLQPPWWPCCCPDSLITYR